MPQRCHVERVLLDGRRAVGVRLADGTDIEAAEVIVSAGAIHSPAILLRSGVDTPGIGEGLKDHPAFAVTLQLEGSAEWDPLSLPISVIGRLSSGEDPGDLQILPMDHLGPSLPRTGLLMVALMSVHSQGTVQLASLNPADHPVVDFHLLADPRDERRLRAGVDRLRELLHHPAMTLVASAEMADERHLDLRANLGEYAHAACTCAIGRVLDAECRVLGYDALRVCDASAMPDLPRANPHLTIVVMAERVSAMIRGMTER
jgi:5-(hydroxymethyl)furfural/furfural oxidase